MLGKMQSLNIVDFDDIDANPDTPSAVDESPDADKTPSAVDMVTGEETRDALNKKLKSKQFDYVLYITYFIYVA